MSELNGNGIHLTIEPPTRGKHKVVIYATDEDGNPADVLHRDKIDLDQEVVRNNFIGEVVGKMPAIDRDTLESQIHAKLELLDAKITTQRSDKGEIEILKNVPTVHHFAQILMDDFTAIAFPWALSEEGESYFGYVWAVQRSDGSRLEIPVDDAFPYRDEEEIPVAVTGSLSCVPENMLWPSALRKAWLDGEPAPTTGQTLQALASAIGRYVSFDDDNANEQRWRERQVAGWIMATYFYRGLLVFPYLHFQGPKGSGKTQVLDVIWLTAFGAEQAASISASALFRTVQESGGTLLIDEAENVVADSDLAPILNAGNRRNQRVRRTEKLGDGSFKPVSYDVYSPKGLASINSLNDVTASRTLPIKMLRTTGAQYAEPDPSHAEWSKLRDLCYRWTLEHGFAMSQLAQKIGVPEPIRNRDAQLWRPLYAILTTAAKEADADPATVAKWVRRAHASAAAFAGDQVFSELDQLVLTAINDLASKAFRQAEAGNDPDWPRCTDVARRAMEINPNVAKLSARKVSAVASKFGVETAERDSCRPVFSEKAQTKIATLSERYATTFEADE